MGARLLVVGALDRGVAPGVGVADAGGGRKGAAGSCTSRCAAGVVGLPPSWVSAMPTSSRPATATLNTTAEPRRPLLAAALNS
jgi:hypothetical protein